MVRYSFLVRLSHPLLYAGLSRRILDNLVRPEQHGRRNREADLLGRLEIDDQLEFRGSFHWKIPRVDSLKMRSTYQAPRWASRYLSGS
jgi:hypothetical protein